MKRTCEAPGCRVRFEPRNTRARYCSATCRQRARRGTKPKIPASKPPAAAHDVAGGSDLVRAVRRELGEAGSLDTVDGQLAVLLARRMSSPDESGISALSKELRAVVAQALAGHGPEDDVSRARRQ